MKLSQKRRLAKKTPAQLARIRKGKAKKAAQREAHEAEMTQYLLDKGWRQSGPLGDVWKHDSWTAFQTNPHSRHGYVMDRPGLLRKVWSTQPTEKAWSSDEVCMTLHKAYKAQCKLDAIGYEKPKSLDDDLAAML